jgi:hypothetical protein
MMLYLLRFKSKMLLAEVTKRDYKTRCICHGHQTVLLPVSTLLRQQQPPPF